MRAEFDKWWKRFAGVNPEMESDESGKDTAWIAWRAATERCAKKIESF